MHASYRTWMERLAPVAQARVRCVAARRWCEHQSTTLLFSSLSILHTRQPPSPTVSQSPLRGLSHVLQQRPIDAHRTDTGLLFLSFRTLARASSAALALIAFSCSRSRSSPVFSSSVWMAHCKKQNECVPYGLLPLVMCEDLVVRMFF